ncbi:SGNH/GDSL hydrolase family protein [Agrococcus jenensis]|uniref:GDSL-like lipase/acylhydrolase family protein n=1 Tax=Agrococcus jenensis TaxID=46353 RepID=A0A3N2ATC7_9MICO|nr:SGNH/GDSL hydrolase family protein [Agrococcus jenensis]ROR66297.1 GDSL-like lipase/acylhydrolase family protein [Agrococcus jenensis]
MPDSRIRSRWPLPRLGAAAVAVAVLLAGCAAAGPSETAAPASEPASAAPDASSTPPAGQLVVLGDSIPFDAPQDCPGCTGFVDAYAAAVGEARGGAPEVQNLSRHDGARVADILEQVERGTVDTALAGAQTVILSAGFNDQPPYWQPDAPCVGEVGTEEQAIDTVIATTPECITEATAAVRADYAQLLAQIRERAPDTEIITLTSYNAWTGWEALDARGPEDSSAAQDVIVSALEQWRDAVCAETEAVGGTCVDLLAPFNGADGRTAAGDLLADDYTHPSQLGNDRIRDELLAASAP